MSHNDWPPSTSPFKFNPPENSVGIVIPMRDGLKFFKFAFHSVLSFTDWPYMLTVIDNMSAFSTKTYLRSIQKNHPVNVLSYQSEFNYGAELNIGFRYLFANKGVKYGIALNSDALVGPYWLSKMVRAMNSDEKIGVVGPTTNKAYAAQELKPDGIVHPIEWVSGFCLMFRKEVFDDLGGFDESYSGGGYEDRDFCESARKKGWAICLDGNTYVHHYYRASRNGDAKADENIQRNRERFFEKHPELKKLNVMV